VGNRGPPPAAANTGGAPEWRSRPAGMSPRGARPRRSRPAVGGESSRAAPGLAAATAPSPAPASWDPPRRPRASPAWAGPRPSCPAPWSWSAPSAPRARAGPSASWRDLHHGGRRSAARPISTPASTRRTASGRRAPLRPRPRPRKPPNGRAHSGGLRRDPWSRAVAPRPSDPPRPAAPQARATTD